MNQREKIINAVLDCRIDNVEYHTMEAFAKMYTDDLVEVIVGDLYLLRQNYDDLLAKANVDAQKLLDQIEQLRR